VNLLVGSVYSWQSRITSTSIDLRLVVLSTEDYLLMAGGGGVYAGGFVSGAAGQGGPDLGVYYRPWQLGADVQAGYGSPDGYGQLGNGDQSLLAVIDIERLLKAPRMGNMVTNPDPGWPCDLHRAVGGNLLHRTLQGLRCCPFFPRHRCGPCASIFDRLIPAGASQVARLAKLPQKR